MRLINYINENGQVESAFSKIKDDCAPFLKDWKASGVKFLPIRYSESLSEKTFGKTRVRKRREPTDTPKVVHIMLDNLFLKYHGWKARGQGLFCIGRSLPRPLPPRSDHFYVFPIDNYGFTYSPDIQDLYLKLSHIAYDFGYSNIRELYPNLAKDKELYKNFYSVLEGKVRHSYKSNDLGLALSSRCEIMFNCDNYWYVNEIFDPLKYLGV